MTKDVYTCCNCSLNFEQATNYVIMAGDVTLCGYCSLGFNDPRLLDAEYAHTYISLSLPEKCVLLAKNNEKDLKSNIIKHGTGFSVDAKDSDMSSILKDSLAELFKDEIMPVLKSIAYHVTNNFKSSDYLYIEKLVRLLNQHPFLYLNHDIFETIYFAFLHFDNHINGLLLLSMGKLVESLQNSKIFEVFSYCGKSLISLMNDFADKYLVPSSIECSAAKYIEVRMHSLEYFLICIRRDVGLCFETSFDDDNMDIPKQTRLINLLKCYESAR